MSDEWPGTYSAAESLLRQRPSYLTGDQKIYMVVAHFSIYPLLFLSEQKHFTDELNKHDVNFEETHWYKRMKPKLSRTYVQGFWTMLWKQIGIINVVVIQDSFRVKVDEAVLSMRQDPWCCCIRLVKISALGFYRRWTEEEFAWEIPRLKQ